MKKRKITEKTRLKDRTRNRLRLAAIREAFFTERPLCEDCKQKPALIVWSRATAGLRFLRASQKQRDATKHRVFALCYKCRLIRFAVYRDQHYHLRHKAGCRCRICKLSHRVHKETEALTPRPIRDVREINHGIQGPRETKSLPKGVAEEAPGGHNAQVTTLPPVWEAR